MNEFNLYSSLALYHLARCPFCIRTRKVIDELSLDIELRDIQSNTDYRAELVQFGGKVQVPCLRIEKNDHSIDWLYESEDIIHFLRHNQQAIAKL